MRDCLHLAEQGRGSVGENPLVGSILVRNNQIIAEGYYRGPGTDHAEANMIKNFDQKIQQEDRLYVNLEPCCHTGETPPCTDLIIKSGIKTVVYGMQDPDPRVSGKGIATLQSAGVEVIGPICRAECERLNRGYSSLRTKHRPYITLKRAQTIDGCIAHADGSPLTITSDNQNIWSHMHLRSKHDAILVGVQTVIADNPQLTVRMNKKIDQNFPQPIKIILDPNLRIPEEAQLIGERTVVIRKESKESEESKESKEKKLQKKGAIILSVPMVNNHFAWDAIWQQIANSKLQIAISSILVEGGQKTWDAFKAAGMYDEEVVLIG